MQDTEVSIITRSEELPAMSCRNFFHSKELFHILEQTPGCSPYMCLVADSQGIIQAHILAIVFRRGSLLPPYLYSHARIYGEGEYRDGTKKDELFAQMLVVMTKYFRRRLCLYIEFSNLSTKMFGYKWFRRTGYTPVRWLQVHNSLHSKTPEERLSPKQLSRIERIKLMGVETHKLSTTEEIDEWYSLLYRFYKPKFRKFLPSKSHFLQLFASENAALFSTTYRNKVIGACACVYSEGNAYLWYLASRRKRYPKLHPNFITIWHAIQYAHQHNYAHIFFMDAGLPFSRNPYREFILSFGGKPVAHYRWFRVSLPWINSFLGWVFRS